MIDRTKASRLTVTLLGLALAWTGAVQAGTVAGVVRGENGRPLSGARVWILPGGDWDGDGPDAMTEDDGTFSVSGIPPRMEVILSVCGADATMDAIELGEIPWEPVDLVLQPAARITGRVTGAGGAPVAGASVSLLREPRVRGAACTLAVPLPCDPQDSGRTDADGRFALAGLKPGVYTLQVQAAGFADQEVRGVRLHGGETADGLEVQVERIEQIARTERIEQVEDEHPSVEAEAGRRRQAVEIADPVPDLPVGVEVRGQVTGPDGEPVPRARVRVSRQDGVGHEALSREDGSFLLYLEDGTWSVAVAAAGYIPGSADPIAVARGAAPVALSMERALVLRGRFPGLDPGEVPRVRVKSGSTLREGEADPDGGYEVTGLTPGPWRVDAELHAEGTWNGFRSAVGRVTLRPGETEAFLDLDFELGDLSLTLQAPDGETTLIASLVRPDGSILATSGLTESPTVRFDRLRPGTYHLVWSLGEHGETRGEQEVSLTADREVALAPAPL